MVFPVKTKALIVNKAQFYNQPNIFIEIEVIISKRLYFRKAIIPQLKTLETELQLSVSIYELPQQSQANPAF
ncbi:hypothetical protein [Adhaeribacter terreus]|uniref:Uncharacterized protein n=1 Tax=Adhaeribacter terreus TaxID=529703 RepID=A0ABW0EB65_9BACT